MGMRQISYILIFWALGWTSGCSSGPQISEAERNSKAHPASYAAEGFTYSKDQPKREAKPFDFYYKHCTLSDRKAFPSKDEYSCTDPF